MYRLLASLLLAGVALSQVKPANPGFEQGDLGSVPAGWSIPTVATRAGFSAKLVDQKCHAGSRCAMITGVADSPENVFGNLLQTIPSAGYNMRRIRLRSAIRVEGPATRAQMWLRIDRADNSMAFLENMSRRPVTSPDWNTYDIETEVPRDASRLVFGVMLFGGGTAWVDDVNLDALDELRKDKIEPPRSVSPQGLTNLRAFARLYGYVRFFHPSDQAASTDWETFAITGARSVEDAASTAELVARLQNIFQTIAPTVQIFATEKPPQPPSVSGTKFIRYRHNGVGLPTAAFPSNIYKSERVQKSAADGWLPKSFQAELVIGVTASVPLALEIDSAGTLPRAPMPEDVLYERTAEDRGTRLAAVIIAWNVFQHFYPYFDVIKTDWASELPKALRAATTDTGVDDFHKTLLRLVAALRDGHGRVTSPRQRPPLQPPLTLDWIENDFLVTRVQKGKSEGIAPGDRILKIDGKPIGEAAGEARSLISGATEQWIRWRSIAALSTCNPDTGRMILEIEPFAKLGTRKPVELICAVQPVKDMETYTEPRPEKIAELEFGIVYADLDRVTEADWVTLVPRLEKARGIIFDMRGYPGKPGIQALEHLTDSPLRSAKWNVPQVSMPDRLDFTFNESGWPVQPQKPYFSSPHVFLTDGRAISYAETVMGIVEHFKLGEIVGGPTAGTNGNVNPFRLPGGYTVSWTGMKVLKHDGSQHHGIGIQPTVPASRTRKGVADGKDEILLRGLEVVKSKQRQ